jgi:alkylhydroperoxidase family enzyme
MMLSLSNKDNELDLDLIKHGSQGSSCGVPAEEELVRFAEAVVLRNVEAIRPAREALEKHVGSEGLVSAAAVVAQFNAINRVAGGIGISLDKSMAEMGAEVIEALGIAPYGE